jgi:antirestriction protein ArdC
MKRKNLALWTFRETVERVLIHAGANAMPNVYEIVTEKIIKQLESGVAPWRKPRTCQTPANLVTQKEYRGRNVLPLASRGCPSRFWLTFNQTTKLDGRIRKGEKCSTNIILEHRRRTGDDRAGRRERDLPGYIRIAIPKRNDLS